MSNRILSCGLLVVLGAVLGSVGTVAHQSTWTVGTATVPWALVIALVSVACLFVGLRVVNDGRIQAVCAAVGVLGVICLFSVGGPGGSVLIPLNAAGITWAIGPFILALIVISWPRIRRAADAADAQPLSGVPSGPAPTASGEPGRPE